MRTIRLALSCSLLLALACATAVETSEARDPRDALEAFSTRAQLEPLDAERAAEIAALVLPDASEDAWRDIAWIPSYADAVLAAEAAGKPMLMWAMNGHPLGCT